MGVQILEIRNISVSFRSEGTLVQAVDDVSLDLAQGQVLGVVGESGSGKSQLFKAVTGLSRGQVTGRALLEGEDILSLPPRRLARLRGRDIAYVFQDPMTSLNPFLRIRTQLCEVAIRHLGLSHSAAMERARDLLSKVHIPDPDRVLANHPHELSGGMRQRVVIAMALMAEPKVLIADEPTTALDATVQLQILQLLRALNESTGVSIVLISHDIGVVSAVCDEVLVMYAGRVAERSDVQSLIKAPSHPYTRQLIESTPDVAHPKSRMLEGIPGGLPGPETPRDRCLFADRCFQSAPLCRAERPASRRVGSAVAACHYPLGEVPANA
ncbi:ABC transporter ATP-binding protein [Pseudoroseicyclus sp. H15]